MNSVNKEQRGRILLVEDSEVVLETLRKALKKKGLKYVATVMAHMRYPLHRSAALIYALLILNCPEGTEWIFYGI